MREARIGPVRLQLRAATSAVHERMHRLEPFARIAAGTMDRAAYADLLGRLLLFHERVDPVCRRGTAALGLSGLPGLLDRRQERLRRDLDYLNVKPRRSLEPAARSICEPFAVGCLYIVQGSTLGGKVIARQLDSLLETPEGREFFTGDCTDGEAWRELCAKLEIYGEAAGRVEKLLAGAQHGFQIFARCLGAPSWQ